MPKYTMESGGKKYSFSSDSPLSDADLDAAAKQYFGETPRGEGDKATGPTTPESIQQGLFQAGQPKPLDMVQRVGNAVLPRLATAPTIMAGGEALPAAPLIGRAITSGVIGGAESASKGQSPFWGFFVDALTGGATEGFLKVLPSVMKVPKVTRSVGEMAEKVRSTKAGEASVAPRIDEALALVKDKLPKGAWLNIPALDKTKRLTLEEAGKMLKAPGLQDEQFQIARAQLKNEMNRLDITRLTGPKPYAGQIFGKYAPKEHYTYRPSTAEGMASGAFPAILNWPGAESVYPPEFVTNSVPELAKLVSRISGLDKLEQISAGGGNGFSVTINLGDTRHPLVFDALPSEVRSEVRRVEEEQHASS
jgi:hypothetical protein